MTYDNTNRGALFKNDKKEAGDNRPEYTGKLNVAGEDFYVSAWIKEGRNGKFMSLSVKHVDARQERPLTAAQTNGAPARAMGFGGGRAAAADLDDDIPFEMPWK
jgi:hypothetical protein